MGKKKAAVTAAGVVALDGAGKGAKVLLVHRPAYDDWSLPKGKVHADELFPACAVRETLEETGVQAQLGLPLGSISYPVSNGRKTVHYWRAAPVKQRKHRPDDEVDKVVWLTPKAALTRLSYPDEAALVERALAAPVTTPFLIVRHGKAMERKNWSGRDQARPVNGRGRKQSKALVPLLAAYGIGRLESSSSTRCLQTLQPYAKASGHDVHGWSTLSEELAEGNDKAVAKLMGRLAAHCVDKGLPTAVCGHRPVLPTMLAALELSPRPMQTAAVAVAHLDAHGTTAATEWHKPLC